MLMVNVVLKTIYAGPMGNFPIGHLLELPEESAAELVAGGYADRVTIEVMTEDSPSPVEIETAMVAPEMETAMLPKAKGRKG
jgi:hypothetical protein